MAHCQRKRKFYSRDFESWEQRVFWTNGNKQRRSRSSVKTEERAGLELGRPCFIKTCKTDTDKKMKINITSTFTFIVMYYF